MNTTTHQTFSIRATAEILVPDKLGRTSYVVSLVIILLTYSVIGGLLSKLPPTVPLYYSLPWGEARLVPKLFLFALPTMAMIILIFNLALGRFSQKISPLLPKVLSVTTAVVASMLAVSLLGIVQSLIL